jgi:hypothetical protein
LIIICQKDKNFYSFSLVAKLMLKEHEAKPSMRLMGSHSVTKS